MEKVPKTGNIAERGLRFLRNVHIAIGTVALGGVLIFTEAAILPAIAAYEFINAGVHELGRQVVKNRSGPKPHPA